MISTNEELKAAMASLIEQNNAQHPDAICTRIAPQIVMANIEMQECCFRYQPEAWMRNPRHLLHGGIIATMLDNAAGTLCRCLADGAFHPTVNMQINYIRPIPIDRPLFVQARVTARTRSFVHMYAEAWTDAKEKLNADGRLTYSANIVF